MDSFVQGILLAAGLSTRMGRPKLLEQVDGEALLLRVARTAVRSRLGNVLVVLGPNAQKMSMLLEQDPETCCTRIIINPSPEKGMSESIRVGLSAVEKDAYGAMIVLGDQPRLSTRVLDQLVGTFLRDPDSIVVPTIHGRRTTPVTFPAALFTDLQQVKGDIGGREVLEQHAGRIVSVELGDSYDDRDVDTPQDALQFTSTFNSDRQGK